jgi:hypothetical protein
MSPDASKALYDGLSKINLTTCHNPVIKHNMVQIRRAGPKFRNSTG